MRVREFSDGLLSRACVALFSGRVRRVSRAGVSIQSPADRSSYGRIPVRLRERPALSVHSPTRMARYINRFKTTLRPFLFQ